MSSIRPSSFLSSRRPPRPSPGSGDSCLLPGRRRRPAPRPRVVAGSDRHPDRRIPAAARRSPSPRSTRLARTLPLEQADPAETAKPAEVHLHHLRLALPARRREADRVRQARRSLPDKNSLWRGRLPVPLLEYFATRRPVPRRPSARSARRRLGRRAEAGDADRRSRSRRAGPISCPPPRSTGAASAPVRAAAARRRPSARRTCAPRGAPSAAPLQSKREGDLAHRLRRVDAGEARRQVLHHPGLGIGGLQRRSPPASSTATRPAASTGSDRLGPGGDAVMLDRRRRQIRGPASASAAASVAPEVKTTSPAMRPERLARPASRARSIERRAPPGPRHGPTTGCRPRPSPPTIAARASGAQRRRRVPVEIDPRSSAQLMLVDHLDEGRHRRTGRELVAHHVAEPGLVQEDVDVGRQLLPELVGQRLLARAARRAARARRRACSASIVSSTAARISEMRISLDRPRQPVAAARAAHRFDDLGPAQLDEELLEIGEADVLPLGDLATATPAGRGPARRGRSARSSRSVPWC